MMIGTAVTSMLHTTKDRRPSTKPVPAHADAFCRLASSRAVRTAGSSSWPDEGVACRRGPCDSSAVAASSARRGSESSSRPASAGTAPASPSSPERDRRRRGAGPAARTAPVCAHEDADVLARAEPADGRGARLADREVGVGVEQPRSSGSPRVKLRSPLRWAATMRVRALVVGHPVAQHVRDADTHRLQGLGGRCRGQPALGRADRRQHGTGRRGVTDEAEGVCRTVADLHRLVPQRLDEERDRCGRRERGRAAGRRAPASPWSGSSSRRRRLDGAVLLGARSTSWSAGTPRILLSIATMLRSSTSRDTPVAHRQLARRRSRRRPRPRPP